MINIKYREDGSFLEIEGHANSDILGKDIVCAGVSSVSIGGINAIMSLTNKEILDEVFSIYPIVKKGYVKVAIKNNNDINLFERNVLKVVIEQLKCIEHSYPNYVKLKKE